MICIQTRPSNNKHGGIGESNNKYDDSMDFYYIFNQDRFCVQKVSRMLFRFRNIGLIKVDIR
jgi:hypothetical protein